MKAQASLRIRAVSPEPSLFAHMKYGSRRRVWPKIRHLTHWTAAHAHLKNEFMEDEKCHNLMSRINYRPFYDRKKRNVHTNLLLQYLTTQKHSRFKGWNVHMISSQSVKNNLTFQQWTFPKVQNKRIFNGCEVRTENSVIPSEGIFNLHRTTIMDSCSSIHPSTIAFKLKYALTYRFDHKIQHLQPRNFQLLLSSTLTLKHLVENEKRE